MRRCPTDVPLRSDKEEIQWPVGNVEIVDMRWRLMRRPRIVLLANRIANSWITPAIPPTVKGAARIRESVDFDGFDSLTNIFGGPAGHDTGAIPAKGGYYVDTSALSWLPST